ncbi:MAG TPA: hypothetical protein VF614_04155 [Chthoniobacteraceae bacterium]
MITSLRAVAADKLLFELRDTLVSALGAPVDRVDNPRATLAGMEVHRFRRDAWEFVIYFDGDRSHRVIISKQDGSTMDHQEIARFLMPNKSHNSWREWKLPDRRAWVSEGKIGPFYALVASDSRALELITYRYIVDLGRQVWLDSTEASTTKQP